MAALTSNQDQGELCGTCACAGALTASIHYVPSYRVSAVHKQRYAVWLCKESAIAADVLPTEELSVWII